MKVQVRRIRPEGIELTDSFPGDLIQLTQKDVLKFPSPFEVRAFITRAEDEVIAKITVSSRLDSFCFRCLESVEQNWISEFTLSYDTKGNTEFIEMDDDIRQELILNLPLNILCRADCKGLCADCGTNLNKQSCNHKHVVTSG